MFVFLSLSLSLFPHSQLPNQLSDLKHIHLVLFNNRSHERRIESGRLENLWTENFDLLYGKWQATGLATSKKNKKENAEQHQPVEQQQLPPL